MKDLIEKAKFLVGLGTQVKPNIELQRLTVKATEDLHRAILNFEYGSTLPYSMTEEERARAIELSEQFSIKRVMVEAETQL